MPSFILPTGPEIPSEDDIEEDETPMGIPFEEGEDWGARPLVRAPKPLPLLGTVRYTYAEDLELARAEFLQTARFDCLNLSHKYALDFSPLDFLHQVRAIARAHAPTRMLPEGESPYRFQLGPPDAPLGFLWVSGNRRQREITKRARDAWEVSVVAEESLALALSAALQAAFGTHHMAQVQWWWGSGRGSVQQTTLVLEPDQPPFPEFYPFLPKPPDEWLDDYLESSASVLLLIGPAGSGKTSIIRHFLHRYALEAIISCEEALLGTDSMFVSFLTRDQDVLVVEDADVLLSSRGEGNKSMARLLAVSDGLVRFPRKKMIFSTNLESIVDIDPALIRPGRCHAIQHFRALDEVEAAAAARVAGLPSPGSGPKTLAELWNTQAGQATSRKIGF